MNDFTCLCGFIFNNSAIPHPLDGWLYGDEDETDYERAACQDILAYFAAVADGRRDEWLQRYYASDLDDGEYPASASDIDEVQGILTSRERGASRRVTECPQCGRLWLQMKDNGNGLRSYAPDVPGYAGVLRKIYAGDKGPDEADRKVLINRFLKAWDEYQQTGACTVTCDRCSGLIEFETVYKSLRWKSHCSCGRYNEIIKGL